MAWETRTEWNLATNPTLTDTAVSEAWGPVAVNLWKGPRLLTSVDGDFQAGTGEVGTTEYISGANDGPELADGTRATTYCRRTVSTIKSSGESGPRNLNVSRRVYPTNPVAGTVITAVMAVRFSGPGVLMPRFKIIFLDGSGAWASATTSPSGGITLNGNSKWQWISFTATATANFVSVGTSVAITGSGTGQIQPAGSTWDYTCVRIYEGENDGLGFIDGAMSGTGSNFAYTWDGTAFQSASAMRWVSAASGNVNRTRALNVLGAGYSTISSTNTIVAVEGDHSRAMRMLGTKNSNFWVSFPGNNGDASGTAMARLGLEKGKSYAAGLLWSQDAVLGPSGSGRYLKFNRRNAAGGFSEIRSASPVDEPQTDTLLTVAVTVAPDDTDMSLILHATHPDAPPNAGVTFRNVIIWEGDTEEEALAKVQTYFDGSSPGFTFNDQYVKPYWEGTPFRSKSFFTWKSWIPDPPPTIQWDDESKRSFQAGLDRGVLYLQDGTTVPWNGLISVDADDEANAEVESYYIDGLKLLDVSGYGEFEASLSAFTTPREFDRCVGFSEIDDGLTVTSQRRESFGLSYRTLVGDPQKGLRRGYKIHLIYGATALSESENHQTLGDNPDAMTLSWKLKTVAQHIPGRAPSAHLIIDTRYMYSSSVAALEAVLYGADQPPRLPTPTEVLDIVEEASGLRVIDNGDGTFTVESDIPNVVKNISGTEFELDWETVSTYGDTYTVTSF